MYNNGLIVHKTEKAFDAIQMCLGAFRILNFSEETTDSLKKVCVWHMSSKDSSLGGVAHSQKLYQL